jgi:hypothetical protein
MCFFPIPTLALGPQTAYPQQTAALRAGIGTGGFQWIVLLRHHGKDLPILPIRILYPLTRIAERRHHVGEIQSAGRGLRVGNPKLFFASQTQLVTQFPQAKETQRHTVMFACLFMKLPTFLRGIVKINGFSTFVTWDPFPEGKY